MVDTIEEIFIAPPDPAVLTDEDSGDEDEAGTTDNLNGNQLRAEALVGFADQVHEEEHHEFLKTSQPRKWCQGDFEGRHREFRPDNIPDFSNKSEVEMFEMFFDNKVISLLVEESNKYALSKNCPNPYITSDEIKCFIGILIVSGYNELPSKRMYWDTKSDVRNDLVADAMRRNRFENILRFLHCVDNDNLNPNDKLWKIRPVVDIIKRNCLEHYIPQQQLAYDESMVKYYGKHSCKQFIRGKPIRFGYKVWSLNSVQGYLVNFDIYQGKSLERNHLIHSFGACAAPLVKMVQELPPHLKNLPFHFYFDNLFTSFPLLQFMRERGYGATGTIRENRIPRNCPLAKKASLQKKDRGYMTSVISRDDGVAVVKWVDNAVVCVASNTFGLHPISNARRYSQKEKKHITVTRPAIVTEYNKFMGGTDRMDQNLSQYRINIRNRKWYWCLFSWLIDVSVHNAWILCRSRNITQLQFRRQIAQFYLTHYKTERKTNRTQSQKSKLVYNELQYDGFDHFVQKVPDGKRRRCAGVDCSSSGRTMCSKCDVGLCVDCFIKFHRK